MIEIRPLLHLISLILCFSCSGGKDNGTGNVSKIPAEAIAPLQSDEDLDRLLTAIGDSRIVLLGEASHGTSEFYEWRSRISQRLITEKGFNIIAVEADWADAYPLNNYVKGNSSYSNATEALEEFNRWPEWMWANEEIRDLMEWLKTSNAGKPAGEKTGFYGLDVYGIWESLDAIYEYLQQTDPAAAEVARNVINCFAPYNRDEHAYMDAVRDPSVSCEDELEELLKTVQGLGGNEVPQNEAAFNALQNTLVVVNAEYYYRTAPQSYPLSWNIRDMHMKGTIDRLLAHKGTDAKIIVWEHNTHVGDARATDMANAGMVNVGQLVREEYGLGEVYIVGFGTYRGKVIAAPSWGAPLRAMNVPQGKRNSWEWILHNHEPADKIVFMDQLKNLEYFQNAIGHRAIGVVYNPGSESGNYVPSILPERYDAFIFIDQTTALNPIR